jgi:citrate lyase beta subunit
MKFTFNDTMIHDAWSKLTQANMEFNQFYPGDSAARQPVHTVYGGAQLFKADSAKKLGAFALSALQEYAPDFIDFAKALKLPGHEDLPKRKELESVQKKLENNPEKFRHKYYSAWLAYTVYQRVMTKLRNEAVEDFRIDFEDGYGNRPDDEEDRDAERTALEMARGMKENILPPFIGIRIKPFTEELKMRSIRTLDIFMTALAEATGGKLPNNFVITLPKITMPEQVAALVELLKILESKLNLPPGALKFEVMIETTQAIINHQGESMLPLIVAPSEGRCTAAHFGVYDYTAASDITAAYQTMDHPVCDFARQMMKAALAGTGIWLSDGATNVMPVGPHRTGKKGKPLTSKQRKENKEVVHAAWRLGFRHIIHSLTQGYYQGWDLHPAQLPVRYAAVFLFFLEGLDAASKRLGAFMEKAAQATLVGDTFDDAATGQGLLNYFLRGINCGAVTEEEVIAAGLTMEEIQTRSFVRILNARKKK